MQEKMTREEYIASLKARIGAFRTSDFGEISPLPMPFPSPVVYPTKGIHPRLFVTAERLAAIRVNLTHPENAAMYAKYMEFSDMETDGSLEKTDGTRSNMNYNVLTAIESKAFRYLIEGDEKYGYEAILAIKNFVLDLVAPNMLDVCRAYGYAMFVSALVYDWCFDLLTDDDRAQLVAGIETRLATHLEVPFPPTGRGGGVTGHGTEAQVYRDWLSVAIAVADEYPDVYELVGGKVFDSHRDGANFYLRSGAHWQGASYGPFRYQFLMLAQILFSRMTKDTFRFFTDGLHSVGYFLLQSFRPDGIDYPMGDGRAPAEHRAGSIFYAAAFYRDPVLKGFAKQYLKDFTVCSNYPYLPLLTPAIFLALNDPAVVPVQNYKEHLPLVAYYGSPRGNILARSAWKDRDATSVYMKIGEAYSANHEHRDAGHFMIYHKGMLAIDSGVYASRYGCKHDFSYLKQTISHNCMLVYNPALDNSSEKTTPLYSGGQSIRDFREPQNLEDWKAKKTFDQARILGADYKTAAEKYCWSYLAGDLTNAYDEETVEAYSRYMLSVMTENEENPMVFFVFDRVTATDPTFKKTFLLHTPTAPTLDCENARATVTNTEKGNSGKLCLQTLLGDVTYTAIGGFKGETVNGVVNETDKQFWVCDRNLYAEDSPEYVIPEQKEPGWGRIEISPTENEKTTLMLNVMYVTDAENEAAPIVAREIRGEGLVGAEILGKTAVFSASENALSCAASFKTAASEGETEYFIAGLRSGAWSVSVNGAPAEEMLAENGILSFRGKAGAVSLSPLA